MPIGVLTINSRSFFDRRDTLTALLVDVQTIRNIDPDELSNMAILLALELTQAGPQSFCVNEIAAENI